MSECPSRNLLINVEEISDYGNAQIENSLNVIQYIIATPKFELGWIRTSNFHTLNMIKTS